MRQVLQRLQDAAPSAFAEFPVAFAYLLGSHATGKATDCSDVDVAVHLAATAEDHLSLRFELAEALEHQARIGPIEVVILDEAPIALAGRIYLEGKLFYSIDEVKRVRYESLTGRMYHDFRYHESKIARERLKRMASSGPAERTDG